MNQRLGGDGALQVVLDLLHLRPTGTVELDHLQLQGLQSFFKAERDLSDRFAQRRGLLAQLRGDDSARGGFLGHAAAASVAGTVTPSRHVDKSVPIAALGVTGRRLPRPCQSPFCARYSPRLHCEGPTVKLDDLIVPTAVATPGMSVEALFRECAARQMPGLPFRDGGGRLIGKASIRHVLKMTCIPDYMVKHAALFGDNVASLSIPTEKARAVLGLTVDRFVLSDMAVINTGASVSKALAVMERHDTTYLFVIDGDDYKGCISIMGIAGCLVDRCGEEG